MTNKKIIVAGLLVLFIVLITSAAIKNPTKVEASVLNEKEPVIQSIQEQVTLESPSEDLELYSEDTNNIICEQPPSSNIYGGIAGSEDNLPNGTILVQNTYGRPKATGVCGTYWYIAGWWFNESEMMRLPSESVMYGISPYAMTSGGGGIQPRTNPGTEPVTSPGTEPGTNPGTNPTEPGTQPGTNPTEPGTQPGTNPTEPGTQPGTNPTEPGTQPGTNPTEPGTQPGTNPTEPGTQPGTNPTEPGTQPGTNPTEPGNGDQPIAPIPEMAGIVLVSFGIFMLVAWKKLKNK